MQGIVYTSTTHTLHYLTTAETTNLQTAVSTRYTTQGHGMMSLYYVAMASVMILSRHTRTLCAIAHAFCTEAESSARQNLFTSVY